jgi:hypothetical protein
MACFELPNRFGFRFKNLIISHGVSVTLCMRLVFPLANIEHYEQSVMCKQASVTIPDSNEVDEHLSVKLA